MLSGPSAMDRVLDRLDGVEGSGDQRRAYCPAHQEPGTARSRTSLAISAKESGVGIYCHAGCTTHDVLDAIGLEMRDLFNQNGSPDRLSRVKKAGRKTTSLSDAIALLEGKFGGKATAFEYPDADGVPMFVVLRVDLPDGSKQFRQLTHVNDGIFAWQGPGPNRPLYRLPELHARPDDIVVLVEGEKCVESLRGLGFLSTTPSQGSKAPSKTEWSAMADRQVVIAPDNDKPGRMFVTAVARLCRAAGATSVRIMEVPVDDTGDDIADYVQSQRDLGVVDSELRQEIQRLVDAAVDATPEGPEKTSESPTQTRPFPVSAFPRYCREIAESGAGAQGVDVAFWAVPMLAILAGCIGGSRRIRIKADWSEPAILWAVLVAPSGMGKSPGMKALLRPVRERDKLYYDQNREAAQRHEQEVLDAKKHQEAPPGRPPMRAVAIDDVTMEAVVCRLADNTRGLLLTNDELVGWLRSFDKYRSSGDDREKWLRIYDGDSIKVDRKATSGGPRQTLIERAVISVVGTTQPKTAAKFLKGDVQSSGLTPRLLIASPPIRPTLWTDAEIPGEHVRQWRRVVDALLDLTHDAQNPVELSLTEDATAAYRDWFNSIVMRQWDATTSGNEVVSAALGKARGLVARVSLVLALASKAEAGTAELLRSITSDDVRAAIEIIEWFLLEAERFYQSWTEQTPAARAKLDDRVREAMRTHVNLTTGQVRDKLHRNVSAENVRESLLRLYSNGVLELEKRHPGAKGGRPTEVWTHVD